MKAKELIISVIICFSLISLTYGQKESKTYDLKYKMPIGEQFVLENSSIVTDRKVLSGEETLFIYTTTNMVLKYRIIEDLGKKGMRVEMEYMDKGFINYWDDGRVEDRNLNKVKSGKIRCTISIRGEISDFDGFEELANSQVEGDDISPENLQEEIIHLIPHLPDHPVRIGDKWSGGVESDGQAESFELEYNLLGEETVDGIECLKISANYTTGSSFPYESKDTKYNIVTHSTGHDLYYFAYKKGFLLSRISIGHGGLEFYNMGDSLVRRRTNEVLYETLIKY